MYFLFFLPSAISSPFQSRARSAVLIGDDTVCSAITLSGIHDHVGESQEQEPSARCSRGSHGARRSGLRALPTPRSILGHPVSPGWAGWRRELQDWQKGEQLGLREVCTGRSSTDCVIALSMFHLAKVQANAVTVSTSDVCTLDGQHDLAPRPAVNTLTALPGDAHCAAATILTHRILGHRDQVGG